MKKTAQFNYIQKNIVISYKQKTYWSKWMYVFITLGNFYFCSETHKLIQRIKFINSAQNKLNINFFL